MTEVLLSKRALDRLSDLQPDIRDRIKDAQREINPERDLSKLTGKNTYKFRVGDYRAIIDWDQGSDTVYVLTLGHRRNIYDQNW